MDEPAEVDVFIDPSGEDLIPILAGSLTNYFCRIEGSFVRYRRVGEYWEASSPSGGKTIYGQSESARVVNPENPSQIFQWLLEKEIDRHGNTVEYRYASFAGEGNRNEKFLVEARYGPGPGPWANFHFVRLYYEDRLDWFEDCRAGFVMRIGKRLVRVDMGTQGPILAEHAQGDFNQDGLTDNLNRRYLLGYDPTSYRTVLTSVTMVGADGVSSFPPAIYSYTSSSSARSVSAVGRMVDSINEPSSTFENPYLDLVDLNGDGLPDLLRTQIGGGGHIAYLNQGQRGSNPGGIKWGPAEQAFPGDDGLAWSVNLGSEGSHLADMDGDGLADLVQMGLTGVSYYRNTPGFGASSVGWGNRKLLAAQDFQPPTPFSDPDVRTGDINFDKRIDIIKSIPVGDGVGYQLWFNLGKEKYSSRVTVVPSRGYLFSSPGVELADFNGDRIPDVVRIRPSGIQVIAGLGYGRFADEQFVALPDGEALTDVQLTRAHLADIDGDGLADLVLERPEPGILWFWVNPGNYTLQSKREITGLPPAIGTHVIRWADMNGNGTTDFVVADDGAIPRLQIVDIGELLGYAPRPNLLTEIRNGFGSVAGFEYSSSTAFQIEDGTDASGDYRYRGAHAMPFAVDVVSRQWQDDGLGNIQETRFAYHDPYYDPVEKQFRGFGRSESITLGAEDCPTLITQYAFDTGATNLALKGRPLKVSLQTANGEVFSEAQSFWQVRDFGVGLNGAVSRWAALTRSITRVSELGVASTKAIESEFEYDAYGNATVTRNWGLVQGQDRLAGNDESFVSTSYAYNTNAWLIRFPMRSELSDASGTVLNRSETYYDDPGFSGSNPGIVTVGDATMTLSWHDLSKPAGYLRSTRIRYDAYGNPIASFDPLSNPEQPELGHFRTLQFDDRFHQFAVRSVSVLGNGHPDLVSQADYDFGFGVVLSETDENRRVSHFGYDSFARLLWEKQPGDVDGFPTREYAYAQGVVIDGNGRRVGYTETRILDQTPGSLAGAKRDDYYHIGRTYIDGYGRSRLVKAEAEPDPVTGAKRFACTGATLLNARGGLSSDIAAFFSDTFDFEDIESPGWTGLFSLDARDVRLPLAKAPSVKYRYDALGRLLTTVHPDGAVAVNRYEPLAIYRFDENGSDTNSPFFGKHTVARQDGLGRTVELDEVNRLTDDGKAAGNFATWTSRYAYRADGALLSVMDSQGNVRLSEYDGMRRVTQVNDWDKGAIRLAYDDASNRILRQDPKGQRAVYRFDGGNRLIAEYYLDTPGEVVDEGRKPDVAYRYDSLSELVALGDGRSARITNSLGRLVQVRDAQGEVYFSYDEKARTSWSVRRLPDPRTGELVSYRSAQEYDSMGRLSKAYYPDNDFVSFEYNQRMLPVVIRGGPNGTIVSGRTYTPAGQVASTTYGNGVICRSEYDARYRITRSTAGSLQTGPDGLMAFDYSFDKASNIRQILDARPETMVPEGDKRRNTQSFQYDSLDRLTGFQVSHSSSSARVRNDGEIRSRYDRIGNLLEQQSTFQQEEGGWSVTDLGALSYGGTLGSQGRVGRAISEPGPHALTRTERGGKVRALEYDVNGNLTRIGTGANLVWDSLNRLKSYTGESGRAIYKYDYQGRRVSKTTFSSLDPNQRGVSTVYVTPSFEIRPNDEVVKFVFDGGQRIAQIWGKINATNRIQRMTLDPGWNLKTVTLDMVSPLKSLQSHAGQPVNAALIWNPAAGTWDTLTSETTALRGAVLWLRSAVAASVFMVGSDPGISTQSITPGAAFLPVPGPRAFDPAQELPKDTPYWHFDGSKARWETFGVPKGAVGSSGLVPPGDVLFVAPRSGHPIAAVPAASRILYYHADHVGSQALVTDGSGALIEDNAYFPFGQLRNSFRVGKEAVPYGFGGKERDAESGLHYFHARYLVANLGRFASVDPVDHASDPQDFNGYAYVGNRPTRFSDPSGLIKNPLGSLFRKPAPKSLPTIGMKGHYNETYTTEGKWKGGGHSVVKFTEEQVAKMEVIVGKGGLLRYKHNNALIDSRDGASVGSMVVGGAAFGHTFIFVQTEEGKMYVAQGHPGKFHHSSFTQGKPVAMAGELSVEKGVIVGLSNGSGHYQPKTDSLVRFTERLRSQKAAFSSNPKLFDWYASRVLDGKEILPDPKAVTAVGNVANVYQQLPGGMLNTYEHSPSENYQGLAPNGGNTDYMPVQGTQPDYMPVASPYTLTPRQ